MKGLLRVYVFHLLALGGVSWVLGESFRISGNFSNVLMAAGVLALLNLLLKPILKLLFFPVNALTLGLFSMVINTGVFYLFMKLVPKVSISSWVFPGFTFQGIHLPQQVIPFIFTLFLASLITSLITGFFYFLIR